MQPISFSASVPWLALVVAVVLVHPSPFAEGGVQCVQCGWPDGNQYVKPCGQKLPTPSYCGAQSVNCFVGAYVNRKTGRVWETRRCLEYNSHQDVNGVINGFLCDTDNCNSDRSGHRPEPVYPVAEEKLQCPPAAKQDTTTSPVTGGPLECVQCGGNGTTGAGLEPCGAQLPPATRCEAKHKSCFMGVHLDKRSGQVREMRGCAEDDYGPSYAVNSDDHQQVGVICQTSGCNVDAERLYSDSKCPTTPPPPPEPTSRHHPDAAAPPAKSSPARGTAVVASGPLLLWTMATLTLIVTAALGW